MKKFLVLFVCFCFFFSINSLAQCKLQKNPQENVNIKPYCGVDTDIGTKFKVYSSTLVKYGMWEYSKQLILSFVKSSEEYYIYCQPVFKTPDIEFRVTDPFRIRFENEDFISVYPCKEKSYTNISEDPQLIAAPVLVYHISEIQLQQIVKNDRIEQIQIHYKRLKDWKPEVVFFRMDKSFAKKMSQAASCILSQ